MLVPFGWIRRMSLSQSCRSILHRGWPETQRKREMGQERAQKSPQWQAHKARSSEPQVWQPAIAAHVEGPKFGSLLEPPCTARTQDEAYNLLTTTSVAVPKSVALYPWRIWGPVAEKPRHSGVLLRGRSAWPTKPISRPLAAQPIASLRQWLEQPSARGKPLPHQIRKRSPENRAAHGVGKVMLADQHPARRNPGRNRV